MTCEPASSPREWDSLSSGEVHVWGASLVQPASVLRQLREVLDEEEKRRADRFKFEKGQRQFTVGRGLLRLLLGKYLRTDPAGIGFRYNPHGKPELSAGFDGSRLKFNLSHSGEVVLYALSLGRELGVDVETVRPDFATDGIAERFFAPAERIKLRTLDQDARIQAFFSCWTRKEAFIKARGKGMAIPLDAFEVTLKPDEPAAVLATYDDPDEAQRWSLYELDPGPGYLASLAVAGDTCRVSHRPLEIPLLLDRSQTNDAT